jgi:hypothetical protein
LTAKAIERDALVDEKEKKYGQREEENCQT